MRSPQPVSVSPAGNARSRSASSNQVDRSHSDAQGETLDELHRNLGEVQELLLEDGNRKLTTELVGVYTVQVA